MSRRKAEETFQERLLRVHRGQGLNVQKFNDNFSLGIPDVLTAVPSKAPVGRLPSGMWLELKGLYEKDMPKRLDSPLPKKFRPSAEQMSFARDWNKGTYPWFCVINTPYGWLAVPVDGIDDCFSRPHQALPYMKVSPTYAAIFRSGSTWT